MAEDELSCFQQRRAQTRIDATAALVQEGGHVAATGALAEADVASLLNVVVVSRFCHCGALVVPIAYRMGSAFASLR